MSNLSRSLAGGFDVFVEAPVRWFLTRIAVYLGVAVVAAGALIGGAAIYAALVSSPEVVDPTDRPRPFFPAPKLNTTPISSENLIAQMSSFQPKLIGVRIYNQNQEPVGQVSGILVESSPELSKLLVSPSNALDDRKLLMSVKSVRWYGEGAIIEHGLVDQATLNNSVWTMEPVRVSPQN